MNLTRHAALALLLSSLAWPAFAATDFFWNCTTPDGIKYADASKCDKGDTAVKVMKGDKSGASAQTALVQAAAGEESERPAGMNTGVCPTNPAYCTLQNYGVTTGSPRTQAIQQFMRARECDFMQRFPERCNRPN
ncbi:MAG: hypothetical protein V4627_05095 [Pseudomonadota bacterium]